MINERFALYIFFCSGAILIWIHFSDWIKARIIFAPHRRLFIGILNQPQEYDTFSRVRISIYEMQSKIMRTKCLWTVFNCSCGRWLVIVKYINDYLFDLQLSRWYLLFYLLFAFANSWAAWLQLVDNVAKINVCASQNDSASHFVPVTFVFNLNKRAQLC